MPLGQGARRQIGELIVADLHLLSRRNVLEPLLIEGGAREAQQDEDHAEVDDVAAVASLVLAQQRGQRLDEAFTRPASARDGAAVLLEDRS